MKKAVLCLFVVISLLSAPIAHAAGLLCATDDCAKISKHDHGKTPKAESKTDDHCCTHNISYISVNETKIFITSAIESPPVGDDEKINTFIAGPPLKPPSHA